jgi:hypothetical protein
MKPETQAELWRLARAWAMRPAPEANEAREAINAILSRHVEQPAEVAGELALDGPVTLSVTIPQRDGCRGCDGPATVTLAVGVRSYSYHEGFRCLPGCNYEEPDIAF